jgi:ribonuclease Z
MRRFELTVLGCGAAAPTPYFLTTSQLVNIHDQLILIDCGEGTQLTLRTLKAKFQKIKVILISHMHADHIMGLPGLIASMNLLGRKVALDVFGPEELESLVRRIWHSTGTHIDFEVRFHSNSNSELQTIFESDTFEIISFPTKHRISTCGFRVEEKSSLGTLKPFVKKKYNLSHLEIQKLKRGDDIVRDGGEAIVATKCCNSPEAPRSYVFAADTAFTPKVVEASRGATLLYHEATFEQKDAAIAVKTLHSTSVDAGRVAKDADVGALMLGHFSNRYRDLSTILTEAKSVFKNSYLAVEGKTLTIDNL